MSNGEIMKTTDIDELGAGSVGIIPAAGLDAAATPPSAADTLAPADREQRSDLPAGPRVRWAGIVWGLVLAVLAGSALWVLIDGERRDGVTAWFTSLTPAAAAAYVVLVIGALALVAGLVGIARRAQRAIERRREASLAAPAEEIASQEDAQAPSRLP